MEFPVPVQTEDGVKVAGRAVEEILPVIQGVGVADLQESCTTYSTVQYSTNTVQYSTVFGYLCA